MIFDSVPLLKITDNTYKPKVNFKLFPYFEFSPCEDVVINIESVENDGMRNLKNTEWKIIKGYKNKEEIDSNLLL